MDTILWEVKYLSSPKTIRRCSKCGERTDHISSGAFRVNAQQKTLDIWLIYRCLHCKTTWNMTIYSRVNPNSISRDLLDKFAENNSELAMRYAMDIDLIKKNGADTEEPPYSVLGDDIDLRRKVRIKIVSWYPSKLSVSKILRKKLSLSKRDFEEMVSANIIRLENGSDINRLKLQREAVVIMNGGLACSQDIAHSGGQENA